MRHFRKNQPTKRPLAKEISSIFGANAAGLAILLSFGTTFASAGPKDGVVAAGQATIRQRGAVTTIDQASQRAAINWNTFSVASNETVNFRQPNASAVILNRVTGNDASAIYGHINANGQVYLVNPNGILFGREARVDVGSLVASTANISNADFMAGKLNFNQPGRPGATVQNLGSITVADGGLAVLVGRGVRNSGVINARLGKVTLAGGDAFILDVYGDKLVNLIVDPSAMARLVDAHEVPLAAYVDHSGAISAAGGVVQLTVATVKSLVDNVINVSGVIRATSVESRAGLISLRGDASTHLTLSGVLDASGNTGGQIEASAANVQLTPTASADASGELHGGTIAIGGDWQGHGALGHAASTSVARGAQLKANAWSSGDGGRISVWADGDTRFDGAVEARGGALSGNGGQVEVSGKQRLAFDGDVDTSAARGATGALLLDPSTLIVSAVTGDESLPSAGAAGDFTIKAIAINRQLVRGTNVLLQADQDITVSADAVIDGRATSGGTAGGGLALNAGRNVAINGTVILNNGAFTASAGGAFTQGINSLIGTGTGAIDIAGATGVLIGDLLTIGKVALTSSAGAVRVDRAIAGGAVQPLASLSVQGRDGVNLAQGALVAGATTLNSSAGKVALDGTLASGGPVSIDGQAGVRTGGIVTPGEVSISTASGDVVLGGAVSGASGDVNVTSARAESLSIRTNGQVALSGGALGSGGLTIRGLAANARAKSVDFGAHSIFSSGGVNVATIGDITLSEAGVSSGTGLNFDASLGSVSTGAGKLASAAAMQIMAGKNVMIGRGGAETAADAGMTLTAGGALKLDGKLGANSGNVVLGAGGALSVNNDIIGGMLDAGAGGMFVQKADSVISAKQIDLRGTAGIDATNLQTVGNLALSSTGGAVTVLQAISGANAASIASLDVSGRDGVTLGNGASVAGTTTLTSRAGTVDTSSATLSSGGAVTFTGQTGVKSGAILTGASVLLTSGDGDVLLSNAVSGAPGPVDGQARAASLTIRSKGAVALNGASLGGGGLTIAGAQEKAAAGSASFGAASVISAGQVSVSTDGDISTAAGGVSTDQSITFVSTAGKVSSGTGLLASGRDINLNGAAGLTVGGNGLNEGGARAGGDVTLTTTTGDLMATGLLQTAGGTIAAHASDTNRVTLNQVSTWQPGVGNSGALLVSGGQVVLRQALGSLITEQLGSALPAAATGYSNFADRYQAAHRPAVGRVSITAARDVELNGLNLDGLSEGSDTSPGNHTPGLEVHADHRIVSNGLIAVNKGNITLAVSGTGPTDGIYLGNSVYSRGFDVANGKTGYNVTVGGVGSFGTRSAIYLFDNTDDKAFLPDDREIAKIVIANNVENYKDVTILVPANNAQLPKVTVGADKLLTLMSKQGPLHLDAMPGADSMTPDLGLAEITRAPGTPSNLKPAGIGLKVQTFNFAGQDADKGTAVTPVSNLNPACGNGKTFKECGVTRIDGFVYIGKGGGTQSTAPLKEDVTPERFPSTQPGTIGFAILSNDVGQAAGFVNLIGASGIPPSVITHVFSYPYNVIDINGEKAWQLPSPAGTVSYTVEGRVVQVDTAVGHNVTRVLFGPGALQSDLFTAIFDSTGLLSGASGTAPPDIGNIGSGANSNPGFAAIGGFGNTPSGAAQTASVNGAALLGRFGVTPVATVGPANGSDAQLPGVPAFPADPVAILPPTITPPVVTPPVVSPPSVVPPVVTPPIVAPPAVISGPTEGLPAPGGATTDPVQTVAATLSGRLPVELPVGQLGYADNPSVELALGRRPTAEADMGRGSAAAGAAPNVFRKQYRIAATSDASICAPGDLASRAALREGEGRSCPTGQ